MVRAGSSSETRDDAQAGSGATRREQVGKVDWNRLTELRSWTPLTEVSSAAERVGDLLFRVGPMQYVIAVPYNERFERTENAPFVTILLWAPTDGAAKRAKLMEIEADDLAVSPPPEVLLPKSASSTYGSIVQTLRKGGSPVEEWADYRVAKDGAFVHRTLSAPPHAFHFRSREEDQGEPCYAINYRLIG